MPPTRTTRAMTLAATVMLAVAGHLAAQEIELGTRDAGALALFERGRDAFHRGWFERADELLREAVGVDPQFALAHAYRAATTSLLYGDPAEATARARDASPAASAGERLMIEAMLALADGDDERTEECLRSLLERFPDDRYARHALGSTLVDLGRPAEGVAVLQSLLADHPDLIAAWNNLGYAYLDLGEVVNAEQAMARFLTGDRTNPAAHDSWADAMAEQGRFDEAIASLARALLLEPRYAWAMAHLGDVLVRQGSLDLARTAYERSLDMSSAYGARFRLMARERIAGAWVRERQLDQGRSALTRLLDEADSIAAQEWALEALRAQLTIELLSGDSAASAVTLDRYTDRVERLGEAGPDLGEPTRLSFFTGWQAVVDGRLADADGLAAELEAAGDDGDDEALSLADRLLGEIALARLEYADAIDAFELTGSDDPLVAVRLAFAYQGDDKPAAASALLKSAAACVGFDISCALAATLASPAGPTESTLLPPPALPPGDDAEPPPADQSVRL